MSAEKNKPWFLSVRGSYLPVSWQGWLTYIPFVGFLLMVLMAAVRIVGFLLMVLMAAVRTQHSLSDMLYMIFPQWVAAAVVMSWLAARKSR